LLVTQALALAEGGESIISPNASLVVVFFLFLIFVFVLSRVLFRPIGRVLDEREALTEGAMDEARAATRQYQTRLADYEATIRQARAEGYRRLEGERAAALQQRSRLIDESKQQASAEIVAARAAIDAEAEAARLHLQEESRQIAEQISRTVLGRAVRGGAD
jgi:F-type H+-transporting ATPase subunit b